MRTHSKAARQSSSYDADSLAKIWPLPFTRAGYIFKGRGSAVDCKARHPQNADCMYKHAASAWHSTSCSEDGSELLLCPGIHSLLRVPLLSRCEDSRLTFREPKTKRRGLFLGHHTSTLPVSRL